MVNALCIVLKVSCVYSIEQQVHCHVSSADVKKHSQLQSSVPARLGWQSLQNQIVQQLVCGCVLMLPPAHSGTPTGVPSAGDTCGDRAEQGGFAWAEAAGSGWPWL